MNNADTPNVPDFEDVRQCAHVGRIPREQGPYQIMVGDDKLNYSPVIIEESRPTGRQILIGAGLIPEDQYILFMMLRGGALEEIRLDEVADLRAPGVELFLAFRTDRVFRIFVNGVELSWGGPHISGWTLKNLAGVVPDTHDVFQEKGQSRELVDDSKLVDLDLPGVEHFVTSSVCITVVVNAYSKQVYKRRLSFRDVVILAFPDASFAETVAWTVTYSRGPNQNSKGVMVDGQILVIKEGMIIHVRNTDRS